MVGRARRERVEGTRKGGEGGEAKREKGAESDLPTQSRESICSRPRENHAVEKRRSAASALKSRLDAAREGAIDDRRRAGYRPPGHRDEAFPTSREKKFGEEARERNAEKRDRGGRGRKGPPRIGQDGGCSVGTPPPGHRHGDGQRCIGVY